MLGDFKEFSVEEGNADAKVLLLRSKKDGQFFATSHKCTHFGAPLATGAFHNDSITCPWHCASFCVKTGDIEDAPALDRLHTYPVHVVDGKVVVTVPSPFPANFRKAPSPVPSVPEVDPRVFAIVGGGAAGVTAVQTLRESGYKGRIQMFTAEAHLPYDRVVISKSFKAEPATLRDAAFFAANGVEVLTNTRVTHISTASKMITTSDARSFAFDKVLVATGSAARRLRCSGADLPQVFTVRTPEDSAGVLEACATATDIAIVGTGFIGMEAAVTLVGKFPAARITLYGGSASVPFERVFGAEIGAAVMKFCEEKGLHFVMKADVQEIVATGGKVSGVRLASGAVHPAQVVLAGVGAQCVSPFTPDSGVVLKPDGSVQCDDTMLAAEDVYVAGDIASFPLWLNGGASVRVEHWCVAEQHGRIAAKNMAGKTTHYKTVPFFWTSVFGKGIRYTGYAHSFDEIIYEGDVAGLKFVAYFIHHGVVAAVATVASDPAAAAVFQLLKAGVTLRADEVRASLSEPVPLWKRLTQPSA